LRNFFVADTQTSPAAQGVTFGTNTVIEAMKQLDQKVNVAVPVVSGQAPLPE